MPTQIESIYGNKVRTRVCGLCVVQHKLLLVNHTGLTEGDFWAPPGGGINFGESASDAIEREFLEEVNITIRCGSLLFVSEYIKAPLHAIELFFLVDYSEGQLKSGIDPEMNSKDQIIKGSQFMTWSEVAKLNKNELHGVFKYVSEPSKILDLRGYFKV